MSARRTRGGWPDRYVLGRLGADTLQDFAFPSQLFRIGLWQCCAGSNGAILRLGGILVQEAFALRRLSPCQQGARGSRSYNQIALTSRASCRLSPRQDAQIPMVVARCHRGMSRSKVDAAPSCTTHSTDSTYAPCAGLCTQCQASTNLHRRHMPLPSPSPFHTHHIPRPLSVNTLSIRPL